MVRNVDIDADHDVDNTTAIEAIDPSIYIKNMSRLLSSKMSRHDGRVFTFHHL